MGASNFSRGKASAIFAVLCNVEEKFSECSECDEKHWEWEDGYVEEDTTICPECNEDAVKHDTEYRSPESYEIDDFKYNIRESLNNIGFDEVDDYDNNRSYCGHFLAERKEYKMFGDVEVGFSVKAILRSAYYEGATLDWEAYGYEGYELEDADTNTYGHGKPNTMEVEIEECFEFQSEMNAGLQAIQRKNAEKWAQAKFAEVIEELEKVYSEYSQHKLQVKARFSNGETIYQKVA